ncbi:hypothetical protein CEXT_706251 [Caerostris extrusa]|uniref:ARMET N-terminal domain-containing protein n=1 Tax=Caerostris extrusa TaxID=172846 RepID=A0AAV4XFR4_CAEEX|nr:hypothetical protein CEXT_706251 [Caerostris extrusa]
MLTNEDILLPKGPREKFKEFCNLTEAEERRFCHYVGALEDSAPDMTFVVTSNIRREMPLKRICADLAKKNREICRLKYPQKTKRHLLMDLPLIELKELSDGLGLTCVDCAHKKDFIKRS